ncbi:MAG: YceI family protein [Bacteroidia bacterium]|nr:MAG: YceI family protein [Bacteroidia bacterium]
MKICRRTSLIFNTFKLMTNRIFNNYSFLQIALLILTICFCLPIKTIAQPIYEVKKGAVNFFSDAPEEIIKAYSESLQGLIDFSNKSFVFRIGIVSFEGFNSTLQREHFNENYMESSLFPQATYVGKIIEDIPLQKKGKYHVRTKGTLKIHGIGTLRIIPATITVNGNSIGIQADFNVLLADHEIKIPRVVYKKLSEEIHVSIKATLLPRK